MAHVSRLVLNCLGFASNVFALKTLESGVVFDNPLALGFGGQFQYLTVIGLVPASLACGLKVVRHFKPTFAQNAYETITYLATPLQGFISLVYWSIMLVDPTMLLPAEVGRIPVLLDVALHLFPGVFLWTDFLVFDTEFKRSNSHVKVIYGFGASYYLWCWICYKANGFWAYPFLAEFNFPLRTAFFASTGALCMMVYKGGALLHRRIHGDGKKQQIKFKQTIIMLLLITVRLLNPHYFDHFQMKNEPFVFYFLNLLIYQMSSHHLPNEILFTIFKQLRHNETYDGTLAQCTLTCKQWKQPAQAALDGALTII